jgi:hypothetical protein
VIDSCRQDFNNRGVAAVLNLPGVAFEESPDVGETEHRFLP